MTIRQIADTDLYIGNGNDARDLLRQRSLDIRNVVNVAKDLEGPWFHGEFRNYKVPLLDGPGNEAYQYALGAHIVRTLLDQGKKVLLHCHGGVSRSPAVGAMALVLIGRAKNLQNAFDVIKASRKAADINPAHWPLMQEGLDLLK